MTSWLLLAAALDVAGGAKAESTWVGTVKSGIVIWHGHTLDRPYVVRSYVDSRGDGWQSINGLPFFPTRPPAPPVLSEEMRQEYEAMQRVTRALVQARSEIRTSPRTDLGSLLGADSVFVDSVRATPGGDLEYFWHGQKWPTGISFSQGGRIAGVDRHGKAKAFVKALEDGRMIILGGGILYTFTEMLAEVDSLRRGLKPAEGSRIMDPHSARDIASPKPIEQLLREGE